MTENEFKLVHSDLIQQVQCIENDLRIIYAAMKTGEFEDNFDDLERANLGTIIKKLKELDYSDGPPDLAEEHYDVIDNIREIRNYWCHQCYLDFVYIKDDEEREKRFNAIAERLVSDEYRTFDLHKKLERLRNFKLREFHRI